MSWKSAGWGSGWWGQDQWHEDRDWANHNWSGTGLRNWKSPEGDKDKYANVSTLGLKHPLPMEDRRELVVSLLSRLQEEVGEAAAASVPGSATGNFRIAVANWGPVLIHGVLFYLCRARPAMPIRTLYNEEKKFVITDAAKMLWVELTSLFPSTEDKIAALQLLFDCRFNDPAALLEQAQAHGFDPSEVEAKVLPESPLTPRAKQIASASGRLAGSALSTPRALQRMGTDEELDHLKKRTEDLQLRKSLATQEAELRNAQTDVRAPTKPAVSEKHRSAMYGVLPKELLQPVSLRGVQGSSASGTSPGDAQLGPSGSSPQPSDVHKVTMQAKAQGAGSANMALLEGKQPCQSPGQAALESVKRQLDEAATEAKAAHANTSVAIAPSSLHAKVQAMRLELKQQEAALEQEKLAEQGRQASAIEGSMAGKFASPGTGSGVTSSSALGARKCPPTSESIRNALREEIAQLEAQKAKLQHEEAQAKAAAALANARREVKLTESESAEQLRLMAQAQEERTREAQKQPQGQAANMCEELRTLQLQAEAFRASVAGLLWIWFRILVLYKTGRWG